ncbi:heavy-metal-associated domain-containing protein [Candidatus Beckwithbacteria bacterium]|nr:heavy-metal-associated domain-containing protein [Candidatus Beckwithbacteria bacterium]
MVKLHLVNIKCQGCASSISNTLEKLGMTDISVDPEKQVVQFTGDAQTAKVKLLQMGYPEASSPEAKKLGPKAKSYISCMIGRTM